MISEKRRETIIEDTVNKIMIGQIVPVIGDDVFYIKDENDCEVKLHDYIVHRLIMRSGIEMDDMNSFYDKACKGFKGMTYLKKVFKDEYLNLNNEILKLYREENIVQRAYLSKEVYEFLTKRKYPLIITTSYSNILEDKLGAEYRSAYYMKQKKNAGSKSVLQDIGIVDEHDEYDRLAEHTIFHILGSISLGYDCALTEDEFLQYLHHLHDTSSRPERLLEYINNQRYILALGCDIPDWTLRFLLYSFVPDMSKREGIAFNGGVIDTKADDNLEEFLLNIDYYYEDVNQKRFITGVNSKLSPEKERTKIFISLCKEEYDSIGEEIKSKLTNRFEIFIFKDYANPKYWKVINSKLEESDYFMPIITENSILRIYKTKTIPVEIRDSMDIIPGLITEWQKALELGKKCIPLYLRPMDEFKEALLERDPQRDLLWPLFFSEEGNEGIILSRISEISSDLVFSYLREFEKQ